MKKRIYYDYHKINRLNTLFYGADKYIIKKNR